MSHMDGDKRTEADKRAAREEKARREEMEQNIQLGKIVKRGDQARAARRVEGSALTAQQLAEQEQEEIEGIRAAGVDVRQRVKDFEALFAKRLGLNLKDKPADMEVDAHEQDAVNVPDNQQGTNLNGIISAVNDASADLGFSKWDMFVRPLTTIAKVIVFLERELNTKIDVPKSYLNALVHNQIMSKVEKFRLKAGKIDTARLAEVGVEGRDVSKSSTRTMSIHEAIKAYRHMRAEKVKEGVIFNRVDDTDGGTTEKSRMEAARETALGMKHSAAENLKWAASKVNPFKKAELKKDDPNKDKPKTPKGGDKGGLGLT